MNFETWLFLSQLFIFSKLLHILFRKCQLKVHILGFIEMLNGTNIWVSPLHVTVHRHTHTNTRFYTYVLVLVYCNCDKQAPAYSHNV